MTPRRRRRLRFAMWACVACSATIAAGGLVSGFWTFGWQYFSDPRSIIAEADSGTLRIAYLPARWPTDGAPRPTTFLYRHAALMPWGAWGLRAPGIGWELAAPVWSVSLLLLAPAFLFFRLSRRRTPGFCPRCHYNLSGVPAGVCPECGDTAGAPGS